MSTCCGFQPISQFLVRKWGIQNIHMIIIIVVMVGGLLLILIVLVSWSVHYRCIPMVRVLLVLQIVICQIECLGECVEVSTGDVGGVRETRSWSHISHFLLVRFQFLRVFERHWLDHGRPWLWVWFRCFHIMFNLQPVLYDFKLFLRVLLVPTGPSVLFLLHGSDLMVSHFYLYNDAYYKN